MSRFSQAKAEKLGWVFAHESDEVTLADSTPTGVVRTVPPRVTAEKFLSLPGKANHTITETAETKGLLLERIHLYEQHLESREAPEEILPDYSDEPATVQLPDGSSISERELADGLSGAVAEAHATNQAQSLEEENARVASEEEALHAGEDTKPEGRTSPGAEPPKPKRKRRIRRRKAAK
jgi:hypothetical protein